MRSNTVGLGEIPPLIARPTDGTAAVAAKTPWWQTLVQTGAGIYGASEAAKQKEELLKEQRKLAEAQAQAAAASAAASSGYARPSFFEQNKTLVLIGLGAAAIGAVYSMSKKKGKRRR